MAYFAGKRHCQQVAIIAKIHDRCHESVEGIGATHRRIIGSVAGVAAQAEQLFAVEPAKTKPHLPMKSKVWKVRSRGAVPPTLASLGHGKSPTQPRGHASSLTSVVSPVNADTPAHARSRPPATAIQSSESATGSVAPTQMPARMINASNSQMSIPPLNV